MSDLRLIHTQGLDEGIRCAMCTNTLANYRGCDGGCIVNEEMYKNVLSVIEKAFVSQSEKEERIDNPSYVENKEANRECLNPFPCPYHGHDAKTCDECEHFGYEYWDDEESEDEK